MGTLGPPHWLQNGGLGWGPITWQAQKRTDEEKGRHSEGLRKKHSTCSRPSAFNNQTALVKGESRK